MNTENGFITAEVVISVTNDMRYRAHLIAPWGAVHPDPESHETLADALAALAPLITSLVLFRVCNQTADRIYPSPKDT